MKLIDPFESAKLAMLRHIDDSGPGIRRRACGRGFAYRRDDGTTVDRATLQRIASLVIPPAWTNVWICPTPNGHIQATGRDARGRKQYRYHPRFRAVRDETKYARMLGFAGALPKIRAQVDEHLSLPGLVRDKVLATVVSLLETTLIRVGNEEYARENASFGLTTMRTRHVDVSGSSIRFRFRGKSGKDHEVKVQDRRVARVVARCEDLPGQILFQYLDDDHTPCVVESSDVNEYLRAITDDDYTAKDFRTWAGTVLTATALNGMEPAEAVTERKKNVVAAIKEVSAKLGNTQAVCRRCYVHPEILSSYLDGELVLPKAKASELSGDEASVLAFLEERIQPNSKLAA